VGSAGEQPARDGLMADKNVDSMGYHCDSPLIFLDALMP